MDKAVEVVKAHKSETLWFNILVIASSLGTALLADENFRSLVGDNIGWIGTTIGVVGFILRFTTTKPVSATKPKPVPTNPVDRALYEEDTTNNI